MIKIIADSSCDLPHEFIEQHNITILPMSINFGDETFADQEELSTADFYQRLTTDGIMPSTAYPSMGRLRAEVEKEVTAGNQVIVLTISDALSGYYKSARIICEEFANNNVVIFESKSATLGYGVIVLELARQIATGITYQQAIELVPQIIERSRGYGIVNTMEYLYKGGRISSTTAKIATALNIKPVINIEPDGSLEVVHKLRGMIKGLGWLEKRIMEDGSDFSEVTIFVSYITRPELADELLKRLQASGIKLGEVIMHEVGPTVGTHLGPGCVALFYLHPDK